MRCFLALELTDAAREHLARVQTGMREHVHTGSFPRAENLHVTLKFLGDVDDKRLVMLCESLRHVRLSGAIELRAARLDAFPPRGPVRIVVASMLGSEATVTALHGAVEQRCRKLGFDAEHRRFHPHVTLARVKSGVDRLRMRQIEDQLTSHWPGPSLAVGEFVLFESHLHPEGSRYLKLATLPIG